MINRNPNPMRRIGFGFSNLVVFKGADFLIINMIFPGNDSDPARLNPHPSLKS